MDVSDEQIITELLALVDSKPLSKVDFQPILERYSLEMDFNEQRQLRGVFRRALLALRKNDDIEYYDPEINISVSSGQVWAGQGGLIRSTLKRKEKLEQIERDKQKNQPTYHASFHAPFTGNFNQGTHQKIFMKQSEKFDIILKRLYEYRYDGKYYSMLEIMNNYGQSPSFDEVFALAKKLENDRYIKISVQNDDVMASLTTEGIDYVEEDSYSISGSPIISKNYSISIVNSPNANLVNQSSNVSIKQQLQNVDDAIFNIRKSLEQSNDIHVEIVQNILECLKEIEQNIENGNRPKFAIKSLIEISAGIASIGSWVTTLGQFAGIIPVPT
jgi:hypothetical protein